MKPIVALLLASFIFSCKQPDNNVSLAGTWKMTNYRSSYAEPVIAKVSFFSDSTVRIDEIIRDTVTLYSDKGRFRYFPHNKTLVIDFEKTGELSFEVKKLDPKQLHIDNKYAGYIEKYIRVEN